jgi:hypothetical protein
MAKKIWAHPREGMALRAATPLGTSAQARPGEMSKGKRKTSGTMYPILQNGEKRKREET